MCAHLQVRVLMCLTQIILIHVHKGNHVFFKVHDSYTERVIIIVGIESYKTDLSFGVRKEEIQFHHANLLAFKFASQATILKKEYYIIVF